MPFLPLLGIVFIVLKLIGVIAWSWWLVLLPIYGGLALALIVLALGGAAVLGLGAMLGRR